jgi:phosphatidylglycerophosphate synthase
VDYTAKIVTFTAKAGPNKPPTLQPRRLSALTQLSLWLVAGSVLALSSAVFVAGVNPVRLSVVGIGFLLAASFTLWLFRRGFPHPTLGAGNLVTLARMALIVSLLAAVSGGARPWLVVAVASVALALDGVDGWLARRNDRVSSFGETLDMEVDSAFTVILAASAMVAGTIGPVVLLLALPRYLFVGASWVWPWLKGSLPESLARKVICVVQVIALIALQVPGLLGVLTTPLVLVVGGALLWSFGRDVVWLWRHRA